MDSNVSIATQEKEYIYKNVKETKCQGFISEIIAIITQSSVM